MTLTVDQHLERHLGPIARGWGGYTGVLAGTQVCVFEDSPVPDVTTYSTLGLSDHILNLPRGRKVRQELLLAVLRRFESADLAKLLVHVAEQLLGCHRALLRGELVRLGNPIAKGCRCEDLYVSLPVVFPSNLATCSDTQPPTVFGWLVPLHPEESSFVASRGWSEFEQELERVDPGLFDLHRPPIIAPRPGARRPK